MPCVVGGAGHEGGGCVTLAARDLAQHGFLEYLRSDNGSRMAVVDTAANPNRFYRVRVAD